MEASKRESPKKEESGKREEVLAPIVGHTTDLIIDLSSSPDDLPSPPLKESPTASKYSTSKCFGQFFFDFVKRNL